MPAGQQASDEQAATAPWRSDLFYGHGVTLDPSVHIRIRGGRRRNLCSIYEILLRRCENMSGVRSHRLRPCRTDYDAYTLTGALVLATMIRNDARRKFPQIINSV